MASKSTAGIPMDCRDYCVLRAQRARDLAYSVHVGRIDAAVESRHPKYGVCDAASTAGCRMEA